MRSLTRDAFSNVLVSSQITSSVLEARMVNSQEVKKSDYPVSLYYRECKNENVQVNEAIKARLLDIGYEAQGFTDLSLNFTGVSLTGDDLRVLDACLLKLPLRKLVINECLLGDKKFVNLCNLLCYHTSLEYLELRGNRLNGESSRCFGKIFRHNNILKYIDLSWNILGNDEFEFNEFCLGMSVNTSVKFLDLKNNSISFGCIDSIKSMLKSNYSLEDIDLQWNSIGFAGSKIILEALDFNKSLTKLNLSGNDIPLEILSVLGSKLQKNVTLQQSGRQIAQCNTLLNNQIKLLEESHHDKMIKMSSLLQKAEASRDITFEETADVMRQLHKSIKEKTDTISSLEARCRQNEKESKAATVELSTVKQKLISLQQDHEVEISKLKYHYEQQMQELEAKSLELNLGAKKAVTDKAEVILKLESTDKLLKQAEESIAQLNEDKLSLVKRNEELWEAKQKALSEERKKMEEIVSEQRDKDRHQVEMLRQESEALILALKNKVTLLEQEKTVHLEKLETHKVNCERLRADSMKQVRALQEELSLSRLQFDNELEEISLKHTRGIKEKEMECEKKDLLVKELEERLDRLNQTSKSLQKELGVLRLELDEKDCEARLAVERLRDEFKDCSEEILKLQNCKTKLEKDLVSVRHDLESCRNEKEFQMRVLNTKLEKMDELLLTKDALIQQMRTDEFQRANILHSAVISYVQSVPRHRPLQYGPQAHPDTPFLPRDVNGTDCDDAHNP